MIWCLFAKPISDMDVYIAAACGESGMIGYISLRAFGVLSSEITLSFVFP
jgi:hypothetical protein